MEGNYKQLAQNKALFLDQCSVVQAIVYLV